MIHIARKFGTVFCGLAFCGAAVADDASGSAKVQPVADQAAVQTVSRDARLEHDVAQRLTDEARFSLSLRREPLAQMLEDAEIGFARVNDWELLSKHAHLRRITVGAPTGPVSMPAPAPLRAGQERTYGPIPALGEHTDRVRKEFLSSTSP